MVLTRDEKCMNLVKNMAIITTTVASVSMAEALSTMMKKVGKGLGGAFAMAVGDKKKFDAEYEKNVKEIPMDILSEITEIKKQFDQQQRDNPEGLKKFVSNPRFDEGVKIVEGYDISLPKITEPLDEKTLSIYVALVLAGNEKIAPMFKELNELNNKP